MRKTPPYRTGMSRRRSPNSASERTGVQSAKLKPSVLLPRGRFEMRILLIATNRHKQVMSRMRAQPIPIGLAYVAGHIDRSGTR